MNDTDRAERLQAWKAFLIPSSLFVACLLNAAGIYILYAGSAAGVVFLGLGFLVMISGLVGFVTFQNKKRAKGQWKRISDPVIDDEAEEADYEAVASDEEATTESQDDQAERSPEYAGQKN